MWRKYARLLYRFVAISFRNMSEFRLDFFTSIVHSLIYQAIFIVFWKSVLTFTAHDLGGWTFPDLVVLSAFTLVSNSVMLWFAGLLRLPQKVIKGELDKYLCKPVSPLFALVAEEVNAIPSAQRMISALLILGGACAYFGFRPAPANVLLSLGLMILGCFLMLLVQGCVAMLSFWWGDVSYLSSLVNLTGEFERYPITLFPLGVRGFLTWIVPIAAISTFPVLVFLGKAESVARYFGIAALLAIVWMTLFRLSWRKALARYEAFGG
ncbi:MAG TPA: ABC-2 family transporter protein [Thermoanaerobaculia bacterium]